MSTRRAALGFAAAAPLVAAPLAVPDPAWAGGSRTEAEPMKLVATRKQITLPAAPSLGVGYIATFELADSGGNDAGVAWSSSAVVDLKGAANPVVFGTIILRLSGGDLHYQRVIDRYGDYPRTSTGAILGGTGKYARAAGTVDVVWPDDKTINLTVRLAG